MKKTNKPAPLYWKDTLGGIKSNLIKESEAKKAHHKEQENALRPYFNKAAYHLGINQEQLAAEIRAWTERNSNRPKIKSLNLC